MTDIFCFEKGDVSFRNAAKMQIYMNMNLIANFDCKD